MGQPNAHGWSAQPAKASAGNTSAKHAPNHRPAHRQLSTAAPRRRAWLRTLLVFLFLALASLSSGIPIETPAALAQQNATIATTPQPTTDTTVDTGPGLPAAYISEAQQILNRLGLAAGPVDGVDGPMTDQALCGLRWLYSFRVIDRHPLALGDVEYLRTLKPPRSPGGTSALWVSIRCQLAVEVGADGAIAQIIRVSTGRPRFPTPEGSFHVWQYTPGWVDSSVFPTDDGTGNMLSPACFQGTYCVHGSRAVGDGATWPGSGGCVRVRVADVAVTSRIQWVDVVF